MRPSAMPASLAICLVEVASNPCAANSPSAVLSICSRRAAACRWREVSRRPVGGGPDRGSAPRTLHTLAFDLYVDCLLIEYLLIIKSDQHVVKELRPRAQCHARYGCNAPETDPPVPLQENQIRLELYMSP